jgi:ABC-type microcin C transport system permease subunit YejB
MSVIGHNQSNVNINSLSTEQKQQLKKAIQELNDSMTRAAAERELQKEGINDISEKLGLDKKLVRRLAKTYFKANFNQESEENKTFEEFYTVLISKT